MKNIPLVFLFVVIFFVSGISSVSAAYSGAYPSNASAVYTNVINYTITWEGTDTNTTPDDYSITANISISYDGNTWVNHSGTLNPNNLTAYYRVDGENSSHGNRLRYYVWYTGNGTDTSPSNSTIYQYRIARFYAVAMTLSAMATIIGNFTTIIVWFGVVVILMIIVGMIKGWFKDLGGMFGSGRFKVN